MAREDAKQFAISEKFALCGGSARWLFGMGWTDALSDIGGYINRVSDSGVLRYALTGGVGNKDVNHIMGLEREGDKGVRTIGSMYIQRALSGKFRDDLIKAAKNLATVLQHPGFHGLVLEADFIDRVMRYNVLNVTSNEGAVESWSAEHYVEFGVLGDLLGKVKRKSDGSEIWENIKSIKIGTWLFPKWNQGCYDAVQLIESNCLRIVQVTTGKRHSMLVHFVSSLIHTLVALGFEVETIDFVFLGPEGSNPPNLNAPEGDLSHWNWDVGMVRFLWLPHKAE